MLNLSHKTKGNAAPQVMFRVFFAYHPVGSLDRLCDDLFQAQNCAVYYTADMTEEISEEDRTVQLN